MATKAFLLFAIVLLVATAERHALAVPVVRIMRAYSTNGKLSTAAHHQLKDKQVREANSRRSLSSWFLHSSALHAFRLLSHCPFGLSFFRRAFHPTWPCRISILEFIA
ncbi:hypothetical protein U9M48_019138 [Paspalum notatum var. saurae]|uniref:Secreted protein n=1 Tax=Paspalum notatum var. saurae TaxID=547442 RepID=A0AAQ3TF22_PASNO